MSNGLVWNIAKPPSFYGTDSYTHLDVYKRQILHHTYEYTVREDIVMAMEDLELTDAQAQRCV